MNSPRKTQSFSFPFLRGRCFRAVETSSPLAFRRSFRPFFSVKSQGVMEKEERCLKRKLCRFFYENVIFQDTLYFTLLRALNSMSIAVLAGELKECEDLDPQGARLLSQLFSGTPSPIRNRQEVSRRRDKEPTDTTFGS